MIRTRQRIWMVWALAIALLLGAVSTVWADAPDPGNRNDLPRLYAFDLDIQAPQEIRELLQRSLDLQRYREQVDLNDSELELLVAQARANSQELIATLGYFSPEVRIETTPATQGEGLRKVVLKVSPGEPTVVGAVSLAFNGPIKEDIVAQQQRQQIVGDWSLRIGDRFTQVAWDNAKRQALRQLVSLRYAGARLGSTLADVDPDTRIARLSVTLESGPAYRLGDLVVDGTQHHGVDFVKRVAHLPASTEYSQAVLTEAQRRLTDSGYFDAVSVAVDTAGDPTAAPVRIQLREAPLQKLVLGVGASTDTGFRLTAEHTHNKVPYIGWRAISKLSWESRMPSLGTELTALPDENNWRWTTGARFYSEPLGSFDVTSQQLRVGRVQNNVRVERNLYVQYERSSTAATDTTDASLTESLSGNSAFTVRRFDQIMFPSSGWGLGLEAGAGTMLRGERAPYGRFVARWASFLPLSMYGTGASRGLGRIALRAEAGAVVAREGASLPTTQLFLTGGSTSVRGYAYRSIGVTLPDGQTAAGRYMAAGSVEWQHPLFANDRLTDWEGTLFVDAGSVTDHLTSIQTRFGAGVGARWKSPIGPLQLDLAYGSEVRKFMLHQ